MSSAPNRIATTVLRRGATPVHRATATMMAIGAPVIVLRATGHQVNVVIAAPATAGQAIVVLVIGVLMIVLLPTAGRARAALAAVDSVVVLAVVPGDHSSARPVVGWPVRLAIGRLVHLMAMAAMKRLTRALPDLNTRSMLFCTSYMLCEASNIISPRWRSEARACLRIRRWGRPISAAARIISLSVACNDRCDGAMVHRRIATVRLARRT
jgi:hypothetical protein